jgi:hypothetical protein
MIAFRDGDLLAAASGWLGWRFGKIADAFNEVAALERPQGA